MEKENKKSKKKVLLYYLVLAICLILIAAVTLTVVFTLRGKNKLTADVDQNQPGTELDPPDEGDGDQTVNTATDFILPVENSTVSVAYEFYENRTVKQYRVHLGMDFAGEVGDSVFAVLDGKVLSIVPSHILDGGTVVLEHANGFTTTYKFIDCNENLKVGDEVSRGDLLGTIAEATGSEKYQGAHLHFELQQNGKSVDPAEHLDIAEK